MLLCVRFKRSSVSSGVPVCTWSTSSPDIKCSTTQRGGVTLSLLSSYKTLLEAFLTNKRGKDLNLVSYMDEPNIAIKHPLSEDLMVSLQYAVLTPRCGGSSLSYFPQCLFILVLPCLKQEVQPIHRGWHTLTHVILLSGS